VAVSTGPSALWYLTRGTGAVTLILLTASLGLGVSNVRRIRTERVPRFVFAAVHRSVSLLAVAFLAVHIITSVLDPFAPIRLTDAIVPFVSAYRPLWLGLGAIACDLLIAVMVSSLARRRLGYDAWRMTHWLAYACWPVALIHGLGTGSDAKSAWMLGLTAACVLVVLTAVAARISAGWPEHIGARGAAIAATIAAPIGLLIWLATGPLAPGWATRAGTPRSLPPAVASTRFVSAASPTRPVFASVNGSVSQSQLPNGLVHVDLRLQRPGQPISALDIRMEGTPLAAGGVEMSSSVVTLGPASNPTLYHGAVTDLNGDVINAQVQDADNALDVQARLAINPGAGTVSGTVTTAPAPLTSHYEHADGDGAH
jgi:sulfoxide reductase heme-binding subunit YedZ